MNKLALMASVAATATILSQPVLADAVTDKYNKSCAVCHATGAANAPKTHDVEAWAPRMEKGDEVLLQSVNNGLNAMPPKGMCFDCSDEEYASMIEFMASPAK
ncbi:MAG: c-type cytochrome [Parahaliea sp.]